jgi:dTDP-4-dehydrorhamnose reductase
MRYFVVGGSGLIGSELVRSLAQNNEVSFSYNKNPIHVENCNSYEINLGRPSDVLEILERLRPEILVHAAAPPSVDWHEKERKEAYDISVLTTKAIAEKCRALGVLMIYVSTAFVFPGFDRVFTEEDIPAPVNFYGVTKLGAELATRANPNHLIVRTDQIYGWTLPGQRKSFVVNVLEKLSRGEEVEVCEDWYNSPTYVKDLSDTIIRLVGSDKRGVYHVVGDTFLNRVEWAKYIAKAFGRDPSLVVAIRSETLSLPARRPNARISNKRIREELGVKMKTVEEGLEDMRKEMTI